MAGWQGKVAKKRGRLLLEAVSEENAMEVGTVCGKAKIKGIFDILRSLSAVRNGIFGKTADGDFSGIWAKGRMTRTVKARNPA